MTLKQSCQVLNTTSVPSHKCYLIRWGVHPSELLEVLFNAGFNGLKGLCVVQPFSPYQFVKERLERQQTKLWLIEDIYSSSLLIS